VSIGQKLIEHGTNKGGYLDAGRHADR
jgi:hypothetical protein